MSRKLHRFGAVLVLTLTSIAFGGGTFTWPTPPLSPDVNVAATPVFPLSNWLNYFERNLQRSRKMGTIDLIFDGDQWSITSGNYGPTGGMWNHFHKFNAFDFGNRGDTTQSLLWRLQNGQVDGLHPKLIVLQVGSSNIGVNTPEQIAEGIKADVLTYQQHCPQAAILLEGVLPRGEKPTDTFRARIKAINKIVSALDDGKKVVYLDLADSFLQPDGSISKDMMADFLHPSAKGYEVWARAIRPVVDRFVSEAPTSRAASTEPLASTEPTIGGGTITWPSPPLPPGANSAIVPSPPMGWIDRFQAKVDEAHKMKQLDLLFDGDSITAGWKGGGGGIWGHHYAKLNAYDFGTSGDTTNGIIWQLQDGQVDGLHPRLIVLLIGTNNLGHGTAEQIAEGIKLVVGEYQKRCPEATILLQGIFPRGEKAGDPTRVKIKAINQIISHYADGKKILYLDFGDKFLQPDGTLTRDIMPDFLHPSAKGYQIWADAIEPVIDQFFPAGSRP